MLHYKKVFLLSFEEKERIMKKIISVLTAFTVVGVSLFSGAGCKEITDTREKTKLLLAREHLSETVIDTDVDVWSDGAQAVSAKDDIQGEVFTQATYGEIALTSNAVEGNGFSEGANYYEWNSFPNYSSTHSYFKPHLEGVFSNAQDAAEVIAEFKSDVQITDKWVSGISRDYDYLMSVSSDKETLFERSDDGRYSVSNRYTRADAKNVYETYTYFNDGGEGNIYSKYIENEYYESSYDYSNGFNNYVVVENSRGYWSLLSMSTLNGEDFSADTCVMKDGVGYSAFMQIGQQKPTAAWYTVFDPLTKNDYFRASKSSIAWHIELNISAIKSGLQSIRAYGDVRNDATSANGAYDYEHTGQLTVHGKDGDFVSGETIEGVTLSSVYLRYESMNDFFYGTLNLSLDAEDFQSCASKVSNCLSSLGMELCFEPNEVDEGMNLAELLAEEFGSTYSWNGHPLDTLQNANAARQVLLDTYEQGKASYAHVQDMPTVKGRQRLPRNAKFAPVSAFEKGESSYANGTISLVNASLTLTDTSLLTSGAGYCFNVGLAKVDENGKISSVNAVPLLDGVANNTTFVDTESITLTRTGNFTLPNNLSEGKYAVVAYAATSDGYRISEMYPIVFCTAEAGEITSSAMDVSVETKNDNVFVNYAVSLFVQVDLAQDRTYTGKEVERILIQKALSLGYPKKGETLKTAAGEDVDLTATLTSGEYRLKIYLPTNDGLAEAYAYCIIEEQE